MDTWIVQFMAIIKMLLWTFVYKIIFGMFSFCCGRLLRVELLGHVISLFHFFKEISQLISNLAILVYVSTSNVWGHSFSTTFLKLSMVRVFDYSHFYRYVVIFHFRFNLFSRSVMPSSLQPQGLQPTSLPCPLTCPRVCSNLCPLSQWWHPTISDLT